MFVTHEERVMIANQIAETGVFIVAVKLMSVNLQQHVALAQPCCVGLTLLPHKGSYRKTVDRGDDLIGLVIIHNDLSLMAVRLKAHHSLTGQEGNCPIMEHSCPKMASRTMCLRMQCTEGEAAPYKTVETKECNLGMLLTTVKTHQETSLCTAFYLTCTLTLTGCYSFLGKGLLSQ